MSTAKSAFDHDDMVHNILMTYDSASEAQREAGIRWYEEAGKLVALIGETTGIDTFRVAHVIAALSPRNPWRWNVFDAFAFCSARAEGRTVPRATTFKRNSEAAWRALDPNSEVVWYTAAPKVRAFVAAILGDRDSVVVDTWAVRLATGGAKERVANDKEYAAVAHAYNVAANMRHHVFPRDMQAITWLVARTMGTAAQLATSRTFKAGTPDFIREAMA